MTDVAAHYGGSGELAATIAGLLHDAGRTLAGLTTADLAPVDEFHFRGREATLELAAAMNLGPESRVLDIGSGLGGPARALAERCGCHVTGIDLTEAFCETATVLSCWVGLGDRVAFRQGDATDLPFEDNAFDAAMTIHVGMNIEAKDRVYAEARRVLKPGGVFAVYDILQGEGGAVLYPVPWAREPSISHMATTAEMEALLVRAGFRVVDIRDSTRESIEWFEAMITGAAQPGLPSMTAILFGNEAALVRDNQMRSLKERRMRTATFICEV